MMKFLVLACLSFIPLAVATYTTGESKCKCFPGDSCWPSEREWKAFNNTVHGRLIKTVPLGSPCHDPDYNEALCEELKAQWTLSSIHVNSSSSMQAPIFTNASCDPFTSQSSPCLMGNYVYYAVNVTGPADIAATIHFADQRNIRLVIRNTGHDYVGRSTGAGGLAIWTHNLKSLEVKDWSDSEYTGKAVKISAGVEGHEALVGAAAAGLVMVTGECPTVGIAGGYTQSGGHSPLSTVFGLAADQTLEFEVVLADGQLVTARPAGATSPQYADLFWALSGSGSGNYGVVVSVTVKAYLDSITSGAQFTIDSPSLDYSAVVNAWHAALPDILDAGTVATYGATKSVFLVQSLTGYGRTKSDMEAILIPFIDSLATMNFTLQVSYTQFSSYNEYYTYYYGPYPSGHFGVVGQSLTGGRFLSRAALSTVGDAINQTLQMGAMFIGQAMNVSRFYSPVRAVLPQWRDAAAMSAFTLPYSFTVPFPEMEAQQQLITDRIMPIIEAVTADAGAYINEADFQQPDWQRVFFGSNYGELLTVKRKYDPKGLFWNSIAVGSEGWKVSEDGRLCKA